MREALKKRFKPVLSPAARKRFAGLVDAAERVEADDDEVHCSFPGKDGAWVLLPPATKVDKRVPASHRALLAVSGGMQWGEVGNTGQVVLGDGFSGTLHALGDDAISDELGFPYAKNLFSPIDLDSGDFYVVHPKTGKLLYQTEGVVSVAKTEDVVDVYLREMCFEVLRKMPHRETWLKS